MPDCTCTWRTIADVPVKVPFMRNRDPECVQHGDASDWWKATQAYARALKGRTSSTPSFAPDADQSGGSDQ